MNKITRKFLRLCFEAGYRDITISVNSDTGFGHVSSPTYELDGYNPSPGPRIDNWPAIWDICRQLGISWGCGSNHQHQVSCGKDKQNILISGHYLKPKKKKKAGKKKASEKKASEKKAKKAGKKKVATKKRGCC